jgi:Ca2+-binding EF-hand superfamily protein
MLVAEGICTEQDADKHVQGIFDRYDDDDSGEIGTEEFVAYMGVVHGLPDPLGDDAEKPPKGSSADLRGLVPGSDCVAYYVPDQLWYAAMVTGIYPGREDRLPDGSTVSVPYYVVAFNAFPGQSETLYGDHLRIPPTKSPQVEADLSALFAQVDADGDGSLGPSEVSQLLQLEGLVSSEEHVHALIGRYDADLSGTISRAEFEPFLLAMRRNEEITVEPPEGSISDLSNLEPGNEILAFYAPDQLWYPAVVDAIELATRNPLTYCECFCQFLGEWHSRFSHPPS